MKYNSNEAYKIEKKKCLTFTTYLEIHTLVCLIQEHVRLFFLKKEIFRLFYETQGCVNHSLLSSAKIIVYI